LEYLLTLPKGYGEKNMPNNNKGSNEAESNPNEPKPLTCNRVIMLIGIGLALVAIANLMVFLVDTTNEITISSEDSEAFSAFDGKLTFVIDNDKKINTKNVYIYGIAQDTNITLSGSKIIEHNLGKVLELRFNGDESITIKNTGIDPNIIKISLNKVENGIYHGSMFVRSDGEKTSVPITVGIKPPITHPLMIVVDGIIISAVFWKLLKFFDQRSNPISVRGITIADKPQGGRTRTLGEYIQERKITRGVILSNGLLDFGTMIFGIAVGMAALFNDSFIIGIYNLGIYEIIALLGMGLGIESVKEFITGNTPS
jgi:hypothetical protein